MRTAPELHDRLWTPSRAGDDFTPQHHTPTVKGTTVNITTAPRCWIITDPDGEPWENDEGIAHFATAAEARAIITDLTEEPGGWDDDRPVLRLARLTHPCLTLTCIACGAPLGDTDDEAIAHFTTAAAMDHYASDSGWSTDEDRWHCTECPPLAPPWTGHRPGIGQLALLPVPGEGRAAA